MRKVIMKTLMEENEQRFIAFNCLKNFKGNCLRMSQCNKKKEKIENKQIEIKTTMENFWWPHRPLDYLQ